MTASNGHATARPDRRGRHRPRWSQRDLPRASAVFPVLFTGLTLLLAVRASGGVVADLAGVAGGVPAVRPEAVRSETAEAHSACEGGNVRESQHGPATPRHTGREIPADPDSTEPGPADPADRGSAGTESVPVLVDPGSVPQGHRSLSSPRQRSVSQTPVCGSGGSDPAGLSPRGRPARRAGPHRGLRARTPRAPRAPPGG